MKYFYTLFLITAFCFNLQAQRNFKPGFIISLKGDTTRGSIDYKDWLQNPRSISFRTAENDAIKQFGAGSIKAFVVNDLDYYVQYAGPISIAANKLPDLSIGNDYRKINDTVFLRTVVAGSKVSLYTYNDEIKNRFFIAEGNDVPVELEWYVYRNNQNNSSIVERKVYVDQLQRLATKYQAGNTQLNNRIQIARYESTDLEKIVTAINGNNNAAKINVAEREDLQFYMGVAAHFNTTSFSGDNGAIKEDMFSTGQKATSVAPTFIAGFDYYFNKNSGKWILRTELSVSLNKIDALYEHPFTDYTRTFTIKETINTSQLIIGFNPQLIYNIVNKSNLKFYFAGGMQVSRANYSNAKYYVDFYENNALNKRNEIYFAFRGVFINPTARLGLLLPNKIEIYAGYNPGVEFNNDKSLSASLSTIKVGVNYRFGKK